MWDKYKTAMGVFTNCILRELLNHSPHAWIMKKDRLSAALGGALDGYILQNRKSIIVLDGGKIKAELMKNDPVEPKYVNQPSYNLNEWSYILHNPKKFVAFTCKNGIALEKKSWNFAVKFSAAIAKSVEGATLSFLCENNDLAKEELTPAARGFAKIIADNFETPDSELVLLMGLDPDLDEFLEMKLRR